MTAAAGGAACVFLLVAGAASAAGGVHVVRSGESLATIAERELGDRALWPELYRANRDRIKDPSRIFPGQELTLPEPARPPAPRTAAEEDE